MGAVGTTVEGDSFCVFKTLNGGFYWSCPLGGTIVVWCLIVELHLFSLLLL